MNFEKKFADRLFIGEDRPDDRGFIAFIVPVAATPPSGSVNLTETLTNNNWSGSFIFSAKTPIITDGPSAEDFLQKIYLITGTSRKFIWIPDPANISSNTVFSAEFNTNGKITSFQKSLDVALTPSLSFVINSGMQITVDAGGSALRFDGGSEYQLDFSGPSRPQMKPVSQGILPCSGSLRGCIQITAYIERTSMLEALQWGFHLLIPNPDKDDHAQLTLSEWMPFADPSIGSGDYLGFNISIDPCDPYNEVFDPCKNNHCTITDAYASRRTFFDFTSEDFRSNAITLLSNFNTAFGEHITLIPGTKENSTFNARLVFSISDRNSNAFEDFHLAPEGDFILSIPSTDNRSNHYMICGMSGTEFFKVTPQTATQKGDILRFISRKPAFIPDFPFTAVSPVGIPHDFNASPFTSQYLTSWATLVANSGKKIIYVSQPKGSALYGKDPLIEPKFTDLLGHNTQGFEFTANETSFFPMMPYSGMIEEGTHISVNDIKNLEQSVVSPQRRLVITALSQTNAHLFASGKLEGIAKYDTTPSGLIVKTTQAAQSNAVRWDEVQLGWNIDNNTRYTLAFQNPPDPLINALQSSDVFLVAANSKNIGNFQNTMSIGDWEMKANIGTHQTYGDYRNIIIHKGRRGKLYDPEHPENSLIANPLKWTQPKEFSIPSTSSETGDITQDESELVILSQWLQTYFENANGKTGNTYFDKFNNIAQSESWTGILFLRVDLTNVPQNLKGIMAGIVAPDAFNAHHLGVEISPVKKGKDGPTVDQPSSIFGLIYYIDPDFPDLQPVKSIAPSTNDTYNYRLLSLKVLFENTSVKSFESYAQLTLNKIFGTAVTGMYSPDNIYKNVLLAGSLQINNGNPIYALSSLNDDAFNLDSNIIKKVEINNVLLSTRSENDKKQVVSWFSMSGFIDYLDLQDPDTNTSFDVFSFGNRLSEDDLKKGLRFSNLGIKMTFSIDNPADRRLTFDPSEITFDLSVSTSRENSLYSNMLLDMESLVTGAKEAGPKESGYLDVVPDLKLSGVSGGEWYGLRMKLNMGSPGALAGKINLNSYLLLSWSPDSNLQSGYKAGVGISLPGTGGGAKMISLQNVMKLSIGQIRLMYIKDKTSFLLLFTEIALKFLGLLKIPTEGNTLFYLFGNPKAEGKASGLGWYAMYAKEEKKAG